MPKAPKPFWQCPECGHVRRRNPNMRRRANPPCVECSSDEYGQIELVDVVRMEPVNRYD